MTFSIYAPIMIVITLFFVFSYIKQRKAFQRAFAIWVPSTMLQYISNNRIFFNVLSVIEIIMFAVTMFLMLKDQHQKKKSEQEEAHE